MSTVHCKALVQSQFILFERGFTHAVCINVEGCLNAGFQLLDGCYLARVHFRLEKACGVKNKKKKCTIHGAPVPARTQCHLYIPTKKYLSHRLSCVVLPFFPCLLGAVFHDSPFVLRYARLEKREENIEKAEKHNGVMPCPAEFLSTLR